MASSSPQVHHINSGPILKVFSHLPDDAFKEDIDVNLKVSNSIKS